jgi:hypothetical protein
MGLLDRFETFIRTMRGFENIDDLLGGANHDSKKRADYLLWNRHVIVEQKVLVTDPLNKPQKFVDGLMEEGRIILYGRMSTDAIFDGLADGQELKREMYLRITKSLEDSVAYADKQTRDTRKQFGIPEATGVLVILNESAPTLHRDLVLYGLRHVFQKKREDDSLRYRNNDGVVLISGVHPMRGLMGSGMSCFSAVSPHPKSAAVFSEFSGELLDKWAAFNGVPRVRYTIDESERRIAAGTARWDDCLKSQRETEVMTIDRNVLRVYPPFCSEERLGRKAMPLVSITL